MQYFWFTVKRVFLIGWFSDWLKKRTNTHAKKKKKKKEDQQKKLSALAYVRQKKCDSYNLKNKIL